MKQRKPGVLAAHGYIVLCSLLVAALPLPAAPPAHVAAAVEDPARWQRDLKRDRRSRPLDILTFAGVAPGMTVLGLFTGGGYWAELFARAVGTDGTVVAHTNTAYRNFAGPLLESRFKDGRVPGVVVHDAEINDLALGAARFDIVFIGLGYHDIYFYADFSPVPGREWFFDQVRAAVKPGGSVVIVDHAAHPGTGATAPQQLHRIDEVYARADWERAGFEFIAETDVLRNPDDDRSRNVFDDGIRRNTDRFVYRFRRPPRD